MAMINFVAAIKVVLITKCVTGREFDCCVACVNRNESEELF